MRRGQRWLTAIFVGVIGLVFAAFIGLGRPLAPGGLPGEVVAQLGERSTDLVEYERIRERQEQRLREMLGDELDSEAAANLVDSQALRMVVDGLVLSHLAEELGLHVSDREIQLAVSRFPGFRDETGRFDQELFLDQIEYSYGTARAFAEAMREDLLRQKLGRVLVSQVQVSDAEAREAALFELEQVRLTYLSLDSESLPPGTELSEEDIAAYRETHEEALRARYEGSRSLFTRPERSRARHLLVQVDPDADETAVAEARRQAEAARARIEAGESFEDVAREVSEDPGSAEQGGDLGWVERGALSGGLEQAVFAQEPGVLGEVVRGDAGFHVVRVEEREAAGARPFEEVVGDLARGELARERAAERAETLAREISEAIEAGTSLREAAADRDLPLQTTPLVKRRADGFVPGIGGSPELLAAAFGLRPESPSSPRVFPLGSKRVLIQLSERPEVDEETLAEAVQSQRSALVESQRARVVQEWIDARRNQLVAENRLAVNSELVLGRR